MGNLDIYNKYREVPKDAQKPIGGGRLKGKTDINPMWRIKALTEQFGPCGVGWKYIIDKQWIESNGKEEISAFVNISLFIKVEGVWSDAIPGTGGSSFVSKESNGLYTNDECFKMAMTDAISVSCKALGFGADIYWSGDSSKYDTPQTPIAPPPTKISKVEFNTLTELIKKANVSAQPILDKWQIKKLEDLDKTQYAKTLTSINKQLTNQSQNQQAQ